MEGNLARNGPKLSIAIIARNAAGLLPATIDSAAEIADEIVVLDTGSTDDTPTIASKLGASLHRQPWDDSFAAARNACLGHCTGDWVLWLDAGERLSPEAADALRQFIDGPAEPSRAFLLPIARLPAEAVCQVRLHPRNPVIEFAGRVRETLDASLERAGITVEPLAMPIERTADLDPLTKAAKAQRNIRLADRSLAEGGPSAEMHNCLGEALQTLGDALRASHHYRQALRLAEPNSRAALESYYGLLTWLDSAGPDRTTQLALAMEALDRFPLDAQLLVAMGGYLQSLGHSPLAIRAYDVGFRHGQIERRIEHLPDIHEIAAARAGALQQATGSHADARTLLAAAVQSYPGSIRLCRQFLALLSEHGRPGEASAALLTFPADVRAAIEREQSFESQPRSSIEQTLRFDPQQGLRIVASPQSPAASESSRG